MHKNILSVLTLGIVVLLTGCNNSKEYPENTINPEIQQILSEHLSVAADKYQTKSVVGIIMETKTGNIIAQVNPEASLDLYEFGSIFKIFNTAMAIENGLVDKKYTVNEPYDIRDESGNLIVKIQDVISFKAPAPQISAADIMKHSCNVGSAQIALDLPKGAQQEFFERIHFDRKLDLDFGTTRYPILPDKWGVANRAKAAFGDGLFVSPVHLIAAVNAMANDGIYVYPKTNMSTETPKSERVISKSVSKQIREIMRQVVEETSSKKAKIDGVEIGGKTGTIEKRQSDGTFRRNQVLTSFVAVFPADKPQYTMLIVFDEPEATDLSWGWKTATWNVVPVSGKILKDIVPVLIK